MYNNKKTKHETKIDILTKNYSEMDGYRNESEIGSDLKKKHFFSLLN